MRPKALNQMLRDGRYKTVFETGTSGGTNVVAVRVAVEEVLFDNAPEIDPALRTVYGYGHNGTEHAGDNFYLDGYGTVIVVVKARLRDRVTFTVGDSLDQASRRGHPEPWISPCRLTDPEWTAASFAVREGETNDPLRVGPNFTGPPWYVETQIHGGLTPDNIKEIVFLDPLDAAALAPLLDRLDIPWRTT